MKLHQIEFHFCLLGNSDKHSNSNYLVQVAYSNLHKETWEICLPWERYKFISSLVIENGLGGEMR